MFSTNKLNQCEVDFEGKWDAVEKRRIQWGCSSWIRKAGIFAMVAKISLGLRKFRNHSENFAILVKLGNFARLAKFRYLAKFTVPSEINQFRYLTYFSLG